MRLAALHKLPGIETFRRLASGAFALACPDLRLDRADDLFGDLVLQIEDVIQTAVEAIRPEVVTAGRIDQLRTYTHAVTRLADAAFDDIAHTQFARYLSDIDGTAFVGEW